MTTQQQALNSDTRDVTSPLTQLSIKAIMACAKVMGKEHSRPQIMGVYTHIVNGLRVYVATDGHALVKITAPLEDSDNGEAVFIPADTVKALKPGKYVHTADLCMNGEQASLGLGEALYTFKQSTSTFPDYTRTIPTGDLEAVLDIGINAGSLANISDAAKVYYGRKSTATQPLKLNFRSNSSPIEITAGNGFYALLMPMRA